MALLPSVQRVLAQAYQMIEAGDLGGAERTLAPLMYANADAQLLAAMGMVRLRQNQLHWAEACSLAPRLLPRKSPCTRSTSAVPAPV